MKPRRRKNGGALSVAKKQKNDETPFSSQASNVSIQTISNQPINIPTQTSVDKDGNEKDNGWDSDNDEGKFEFYVKGGKHKKFK